MLGEKLKHLEFRHVGIAQAISGNIVQAIMSGVLKEGEQLVEADLQKHYGVSKSPVREALREVEKMGFVEIRPRRGAFVRAITQRDIEENFRVRAVLEAQAAREAYPRMTEEERAEMRACLEQMRQAVVNNDPKRYWESHRRFHDSYLNASHNQTLIRILQTLRMQNTWYRYTGQLYSGDLPVDLAPHVELAEHFLKKDISEDELERIMRAHTAIGLRCLQAAQVAAPPAAASPAVRSGEGASMSHPMHPR